MDENIFETISGVSNTKAVWGCIVKFVRRRRKGKIGPTANTSS